MLVFSVEALLAFAAIVAAVTVLLSWRRRPVPKEESTARAGAVHQLLHTLEPQATSANPEHVAELPSARGVEPKRILVVEDEAGVRAYVTSTLRNLGYDVVETAHGAAALDVVKHDPNIDLVFTDVVLPGGMSGFDVAKAAKAHNPRLKVLLTSAYSEVAQAYYEGPDLKLPILQKPYRRNELAEVIASLIGPGGRVESS